MLYKILIFACDISPVKALEFPFEFKKHKNVPTLKYLKLVLKRSKCVRTLEKKLKLGHQPEGKISFLCVK